MQLYKGAAIHHSLFANHHSPHIKIIWDWPIKIRIENTNTALAQYQRLLFIYTAIDIRNAAHIAGMNRYHEHINTSYASLEIARAALNSLFADEGYN